MLDVLEKEKAAVQKKGEHFKKKTWIYSLKHGFILLETRLTSYFFKVVDRIILRRKYPRVPS